MLGRSVVGKILGKQPKQDKFSRNMAHIFVNEKTGKKEKHIQCSNCLEYIPYSEYDKHTCENMLNRGSSLD